MTSRHTLTFALLGFLALGSSLWYLAAAPAAPAKKPQYQCPMHPQVVQDRPGRCPICGMNLVEVKQTPPQQPTRAAQGGCCGGAQPQPSK